MIATVLALIILAGCSERNEPLPRQGKQTEMEEIWFDLRAATLRYAEKNKRTDGMEVLLDDLTNEVGGPVAPEGESSFVADGWSVDLKKRTMSKVVFGPGHIYSLAITFDSDGGAVQVREVGITRDTVEADE
ncbi:MAG: hypothetical protein WD847_16260 [Pirellulales bacterium]